MKYNLLASLVAGTLCISNIAFADENKFRIGFGADLGVPSGIEIGVVVHPMVDWVSTELSFTENVLSPGGRASVRLDPMALLPKFPLGLFVDIQGGFFGQGTVPTKPNWPSLGYDYLNFYGGIRLGRATGFNWVFEAGPTYMHATTGNFQSIIPTNVTTSNLVIGNPSVSGWAMPTFMTGFQVVWP